MIRRTGKINRIFRITLPEARVASLPPDFISLTIDVSLMLGGHWWGGSKGTVKGVAKDRVEALDWLDPRLLRFARPLAPAMLRIGGTEADRIGYRIKKKWSATLVASHEFLLQKGLWKRVNTFARKAKFDILFVIGAGPGNRDGTGAWLSANARKLIAHAAKKNLPVTAWELGNEVNGFPFVHGFRNRVSGSRYAEDFAVFSRLVHELHPGARAVGPGSSVWPVIGEPNPILPTFARSGALMPTDILSWHYYPQQSSRGRIADRRATEGRLLVPRRLDSVKKRARSLRLLADGREIWMTETGHALYGGEPGLSNTHCSSLWWLDQLGLLAREGTSRVFRQSLAGADYGLLDQTSFEPRPDYYATFLWKRLMGNEVFRAPEVVGPDRRLRVYRHSSPSGEDSSCLLLINLRDRPSRVTFEGCPRECFVISPENGLRSRHILLNEVPVEEDLIFAWGKKKTIRKYRIHESDESLTQLPAYSYAFIVLGPRGQKAEQAGVSQT